MTTHSRARAAVVVAGTGLLLLSACGSGTSSTTSPGPYGGTSTSSGSSSGSGSGYSAGQPYGHTAASPATTSADTVTTGHTSVGTILVNGQKMTIYGFATDTRGHSTCSGSCAAYWPPVPASEAPAKRPAGVTATFGSITRSDGTRQLTVDGYPMYTYAGDSAPGDTNGQGLNASGGLWWVVAPDGSWIKG